jgi:hypothetical protein
MVLCWVISAQIVNLHNDGVPERALEARIERVLGWGYLEATSASVTETAVSTECKFVDRGRESGSEVYAACCRIISVQRGRRGVPSPTQENKPHNAYRDVYSYEQM